MGCQLFAAVVGDFDFGALLDGDGVAVGRSEVDGGPGRGDEEGDAVLLREDCDSVGADFVGDVAVGGDTVRSDDDGLDFALAHEAGSHVVAKDGGGNAVVHELPRGEAGALQERPRFIGVDMDLVALLDGGADDAERRAVATGGQGAGIAVGEDAAGAGQQCCSMGTHAAAGGNVFVVHAQGFSDERGSDAVRCGSGSSGLLGEAALHALDGPEEIDGGGAGGGEGAAHRLELGGQRGDVGGVAGFHAKSKAHSGRDADGRRATNDHGCDDLRDLLVTGGEDVGFFER